MNRYRYIFTVVFFVLQSHHPCCAQAIDSAKIVTSLSKCWRVISHEYSTIYGLEEDEIKHYSTQKICLGSDSLRTYYGVSYAPKYLIKKVNAESYAKSNFDCTKKRLGISADSVFEVTIQSYAKSLKNESMHKITNVIAFDGDCIYAVVDGVIFRLFDADAKVIPRASN